MSVEEFRKRTAALIYRLLDSEISGDAAVREYSSEYESHVSVDKQSAFHVLDGLWHYRDDEDIRAKDEKYAELQRDALRRMADALSRGESADGMPYW